MSGDGKSTSSAIEALVHHLRDGPYTGAEFAALRQDFLSTGFVKLGELCPGSVKAQVAAEADELLEQHAQRRELRLAETGNTPRRLSNVRRQLIHEHGGLIPQIYGCPELLALLARITDEPVLLCPYEDEQYVVTRIEQPGDTHGWHWDDYSFALVWIIDCPPAELGGFVQCVPHTAWDKRDPRLCQAFISQPIYSFELAPGDLYLLRSDTTLHRVYPLLEAHRRVILNMAFASPEDLRKPITHETMEQLWAESAS